MSSWNKGLTKETDERVARGAKTLSENMQGKTLSQEHKDAISRGLDGHECSDRRRGLR